MKIKGHCTACTRDFPADLVISGQTTGRCPFCGTPMDADYSGNFVNALAALQRAGTAVESALDQLAGLGATFAMDEHSLLDPIRVALAQRAKSTAAKQPA